jgi:hypothetical protein
MMKKYFAILGIFLTLGMGSTSAQNAQANDPNYSAQNSGQYPQSQYPQSQGGQYPSSQYPYPSGPAPTQQSGDYQGQGGPGPDQNGQGAPPPPYDQSGQNGQQQQGQQGQSDANMPGAARISFLRGDVSTQRGDNGQWVAATINTPIAADDRIATGSDARAEVQLDFSSVLRLSTNATASIAGFTKSNVQVQVGQGVVDFAVLRQGGAAPEIDTPNSSVYPNGVGDYRITVNSAGETLVTVRSGSAEVYTPQGSTQVNTGQLITIEGTDNPQYRVDAAPGRDEWDTWNADRDHTILSAGSWKNTNPYYVGSQDLDQHGTWSEIPDYGQVWTPDEGPDWAPYRDGSWVYEPYYGWTWVSSEPWGWAPYHYGRWFVHGGGWVWWPGPVAAYPAYYPIWAPAYVSFYGFGGGVGVSFGFGFGRVGWLPCGPGDWYHPWYGGWGGRYGVAAVANFHGGFAPLGVGRQNFSTVGEAYRNDRVRGGFSSMGGNEFGRGAVAAHQERIGAADFGRASMMTGRMPVAPSRASYSATSRPAGAGAMRVGAVGAQEHFYSARGGAAAGYGRGAAAGGANGGGFGVNRGAGSLGTNGGGFSNRATTAPNGAANGGWQHFAPNAGGTAGAGSHVYEQQGSARYGTEGPQAAGRSQNYGGYSNASRPTLNMRQPIATQRSTNGNFNRGGNERPAYNNSNAGRGTSSAPRPSYSAPAGGGYRGGGESGGNSRGGGGGGSAPQQHGGGGGGSAHGGGGGGGNHGGGRH